MSASRNFDRSANHLARRFSTSIDGARRSPGAEHANRCSLDDIAHCPCMQPASFSLAPGHNVQQRPVVGRDQQHRSAINPP